MEQRHVDLLYATHFPPVEVEELRSFTSLENQVEVGGLWQCDARECALRSIQVGDVRVVQVERQRLPLLPATRTRYVECTEQTTAKTVDTQLYLSPTQTTGHTSQERTGYAMAETDVLQLDIVTVMDVGYIDTHLVVTLSLHALGEGHCLGLHLAEGIECGNRFHTLVSRHDSGEAAIGIILKLLDSHTSAKATTFR